jgi:hypothetical protein
MRLVKSVSGTWHIWHSDVYPYPLVRTDCDRLIKSKKFAEVEWTPLEPGERWTFPIGMSQREYDYAAWCTCCHWYRRQS